MNMVFIYSPNMSELKLKRIFEKLTIIAAFEFVVEKQEVKQTKEKFRVPSKLLVHE